MNTEIKENIDIILISLNKIRVVLQRDPKVKFAVYAAYYLIKLTISLIRLCRV